MKRILLVGSLSNIHIYNYILNVLSKTNLHITVYHTSSLSSIRQEYMDLYHACGIDIIGGYNINEVGKIKFIWHLYKTLREIDSFDHLHLHYVSHYIAPLLYLFRRKFKQIILTYWGSDLLRSDKIKLSLTSPIVEYCDKISFITADMQKHFQSIYGEQYDNKCQILDFGNLFFEKIDNYQKAPLTTRGMDLKDWKLSDSKTTITIGYCGRLEMRQYETIQALLKLPTEYANNIQLIIPAWGISHNLKEKIVSLCEINKVSYQLFDNFMGPHDIAKLRTLTDIFIHAQTTDALSSAMLEHLYGGSIVLNGSWLKYGCLDDAKVYYIKFEDFDMLTSEVINILKDVDIHKSKATTNKTKISNLASWETWRGKWLSLYN